MATPSKRSQVAGIQTITSNQPVARPVDTFVSYRPPAKKEGASALLDALSTISPVLGKMAESNRKAKAAQEATVIDRQFLSDPDGFVADFTSGKYQDFMTPSQVLAGEHMGKRMARQYGAALKQGYAKSGLGESDDATAFNTWEEAQRARFIVDNKDMFGQAGVVKGFSDMFRTYTSNIDSAHQAAAVKNLVDNQTANFSIDISSKLDAVIAGTLDAQGFASHIKMSQNDSKLGYNFSNKTANTVTLDTIIKYATEDPDLTYTERNSVLNLAFGIETTKGSFLGNTQEGQMAIGKARASIETKRLKEEEQRHKMHTRTKTLVQDGLQSIIQQKLQITPDAKLEDILTTAQLEEARVYFPEIISYHSNNQAFFQGKVEEVDSQDTIAMRIELAKATTTAKARDLITGWQVSGRLKNNPTVFNTLWQQADKIKEVKDPALTDFTTDRYYSTYYRDLNKLIGVDPNTGFSPFPVSEDKAKKLNHVTIFFEKFVDLYYTSDYQSFDNGQKRDAVKALFSEAKQNILAEVDDTQQPLVPALGG